MNESIKQSLLRGRLVLLLGAGASFGSTRSNGKSIPLGGETARILAERIGVTDCEDALAHVYSAVKETIGEEQVNLEMESLFKHTTPTNNYIELLKYPFFRIYSLNIDDCMEKASGKHVGLKFNVKLRNDKITEPDQLFQTIDYIKLNGDINRVSDGFIFSPQEYAKGSSKPPLWYQEVARDFTKYTFLFIGTELEEPLFQHMVEAYRATSDSTDYTSYLLTPALSKIKAISLKASKIEHIPGTMTDFIDWLNSEFTNPPKGFDILKNVHPTVAAMIDGEKERIQPLFSSVTAVERGGLSLLDKNHSKSKIREFYKGFKPTWRDIIDNVPALLSHTEELYLNTFSEAPNPLSLFILNGAAGCGKTTSLKQLALHLSDKTNNNVYFVEEYVAKLDVLIKALDERNEELYYVFFDRIGDVATQVSDIISKKRSSKVVFVSAENLSTWNRRVNEHLGDKTTLAKDISSLIEEDADRILDKIERYGNWTRLSKMYPAKRRSELLQKSKKQLLIGLMEATSGEGYNNIIKKDYASIENDAQKYLLILSGIATTQRVPANESTLSRALDNLDLDSNVHRLASQMTGILKYSNGNVITRHRIYVERLFERHVSPAELYGAIRAYLKAFTVYDFPISLKITKNEMSIYKHMVNAKSLNNIFRGNKEYIIGIYEEFEKDFEREGLFLMQYGLALRAFDDQTEALDKLKIAFQAYPENPQIEHSLAHQKLIIACRTEEEGYAMSLLEEAESVLKRLDRAGIQLYDTYPITALSEGHVQILDRFGHKESARTIANLYHNQISKAHNVSENHRLKKTLGHLMKYSATLKWPTQTD